MKKHIILPLSLLLSFVAVRASEVEQPAPIADAVVAVIAEAQATPVAPTPTPAAPTPKPVVPTPAAAPSTAIPTEADINNLLGLVAAYQHQAGVLKSLHELACDDTVVSNLPNEDSVRSLLNLLELHKKEADLINSLRASLASIQTALGQWDADVASLVTKQKKAMAKQKIAKRSGTDFGIIKDLNKPRGNN